MSLNARIKLRHLLCFYEIARAGSLGEAAHALGVTQPAASKTLREIEEILGRRLFDRTGRRLQLNAAGQVFQRHVGSALAELERGERAIRGTLEIGAKLAIGVLPTAAGYLMPQAAIAFQAKRPECALRISTGPNWLLLSQLREGSLDLVVGRLGEPNLMAGLSFEQLYSEDVVPVVRGGHPVTGPVDASILQFYTLILPPKGAAIGPLVRRYLVSVGANNAVASFETVALPFARQVLSQSDAIWFISRGVVAQELESGKLRELALQAPMMAGPVGISLRENSSLDHNQGVLVEQLRLTARKMRDP